MPISFRRPWVCSCSNAHYLIVYTYLRFDHLDSETAHDIQLQIGNEKAIGICINIPYVSG